MRISSLLLVLALTVAACGAPDQPASEAEAPVAAVADQRPDAQNTGGNPEGEIPPGWNVRHDREGDFVIGTNPDSSDTYFVTMTPGWHITTQPAGIFYHPASTAEGAFTATTNIFLFPPGERREAYGLFVGGQNLEEDNQTYLYFLVRRTGEYLVKKRVGAETEEVIGWTANEAIVPYTEETEGTTENSLTVTVDESMVHFLVNGTEVASLPREGLQTDGVVGLRVNHALNLHVSDLTVTPAA